MSVDDNLRIRRVLSILRLDARGALVVLMPVQQVCIGYGVLRTRPPPRSRVGMRPYSPGGRCHRVATRLVHEPRIVAERGYMYYTYRGKRKCRDGSHRGCIAHAPPNAAWSRPV